MLSSVHYLSVILRIYGEDEDGVIIIMSQSVAVQLAMIHTTVHRLLCGVACMFMLSRCFYGGTTILATRDLYNGVDICHC